MPRQSRDEYMESARQLEALATIASGENPDGSEFTLPTSPGDAGGEAWVVRGITTTIAASFTRPADTTAYAALDVVGPAVTAVVTFTDVASDEGASGYITGLRLWTNQSTNVAQYKVHFYHTAPTAIADNAPFTLLWANRDKRIGSVTLSAAATEGTGSDAAAAADFTIRIPYKAAAGSRDILAMVETLTAFTPASGQQFYLELAVENN